MSLSEERALTCGYVRVEDLAVVALMTLREVGLLAAMAIRHRDSVVSDRQTDLDRGVQELSGQKPYWWTV